MKVSNISAVSDTTFKQFCVKLVTPALVCSIFYLEIFGYFYSFDYYSVILPSTAHFTVGDITLHIQCSADLAIVQSINSLLVTE